MTAPDARTLAETVAEGQRLCAAPNDRRRDLDAQIGAIRARDVFALTHFERLLAVAEAAVEWEAADAEQRRVPAWSRDTDLFERMLFRSQSATRALRAAVRGEEKTS